MMQLTENDLKQIAAKGIAKEKVRNQMQPLLVRALAILLYTNKNH